jgi:NADH:ubiquinone oxidoreductase subunit 3 (subunit A)
MISNKLKKVKGNRDFLILITVIFLACLFCFSLGWLMGKTQAKQPLQFHYEDARSI